MKAKVPIYIFLFFFLLKIVADRTTTYLRFYKDSVLQTGCEIETFIDSIPIDDNQGKEIVMKVSSPQISNNNVFYTDSQGLDLQKRILNYRPTWNLTVHQPSSGNYYPINGMIAIEDVTSGVRMTYIYIIFLIFISESNRFKITL